MSFILDALKKSESDRQRQSGPSLFEVKVAPPQRKLPVWAVAIAVLLLVNVIVISWMLLRHPAQQASPTGSPATPPAASMTNPAGSGGAAVPQASPGRGAAAPREAALPSGFSEKPAGSAQQTPESASRQPPAGPDRPAQEGPGQQPAESFGQGAAGASSQAAESSRPSSGAARLDGSGAANLAQPAGSDTPSDHAPAVEPAVRASSGGPVGLGGGAAEGLPLYQQIVTSDGLPELHLDLHVFADRPRDRFVMINMHRMGEGDSLPSGVQVETIRPDGVVLSYHGTRFLLPRSN